MHLHLFQKTFGPYDFAAEFLGGFNFTAKFDFGNFGLALQPPPVRETGTVHDSYNGEDVSVDYSVDGTTGQHSCWHRQHCKNCMYRIKSVKSTC
jgi:hypothetical protein